VACDFRKMLFSNLVATLRADLDAIKDDLGEFVTTVKTDTTAMLGLDPNSLGGLGANPTSDPKFLEWEEVLWDNPELLSENPVEPEWETFAKSSPVREEEVEVLLSGAASDIVPELYRELVPSKTTHADFFLRLFYHKNRLNQAARAKLQNLVKEEEETRWDDDDIDAVSPIHVKPLEKPESEEEKTPQNDEELVRCRTELVNTQAQMRAMMKEIAELKSALELSEAKRVDLENKLRSMEELPHKKVPIENEPLKSITRDTSYVAVEEPATPLAVPKTTPASENKSVPSGSWEALPASPASSSNEEPVVLTKQDSNEEEEEDDWE